MTFFPNFINHYAALGLIVPTNDFDILKRAWRYACKTAHPDRGGSDEKQARVNVAWEVLRDEKRRATYMREYRRLFTSPPVPPRPSLFHAQPGPGSTGFSSGGSRPPPAGSSCPSSTGGSSKRPAEEDPSTDSKRARVFAASSPSGRPNKRTADEAPSGAHDFTRSSGRSEKRTANEASSGAHDFTRSSGRSQKRTAEEAPSGAHGFARPSGRSNKRPAEEAPSGAHNFTRPSPSRSSDKPFCNKDNDFKEGLHAAFRFIPNKAGTMTMVVDAIAGAMEEMGTTRWERDTVRYELLQPGSGVNTVAACIVETMKDLR